MPSKFDPSDRRKVLPGYPVEFKFTDPDKLKEYMSGDRITCLRCGKEYKTLGVHLKTIHDMEPDEYREIYGIPWSYGLSCSNTKDIKSEKMHEVISSGLYDPRENARKGRENIDPHKKRKKQPVSIEYYNRHIAELNEKMGNTGEVLAYRRSRPKRGTPEHYQVMINRPQCKNAGERLGDYWRGREQTDEHVFKRTGYHKKS